MPFDGKNFTKAEPDVFSLDGLIAWLEHQPGERTYNWASCDRCLVAQYLRAVTGKPHPKNEWIFSNALGRHWGYFDIAGERPYTFGAALRRALRVKAEG